MYIVVIGAGQIGYHLTRALLNAGHEVALIEADSKKVRDLEKELGNIIIRGDGSESRVLVSAGVSRADVLIATTGNDEENLGACQVAKHQFNVGRTIARFTDPENEALFQILGVDVVVSSTQIILAGIEEELPVGVHAHHLPVRGNREIIRVEIPPRSLLVDNILQSDWLPTDTIVTAVIDREGQLKPLDAIIESHDEVIAMTTSDNTEALREILTGEG